MGEQKIHTDPSDQLVRLMSDQVYFDDFSSIDDVVNSFAQYDQGDPDQIRSDLEGAEVLFAFYGHESYDGQALVVFRRGGELFMVEGGHCSCHGLEGQWAPSRVVPKVLATTSRYTMSTEAETAFNLLIAKLGGDL